MSTEFERIDLLLRAFEAGGGSVRGPSVLLGPGDDCALLSCTGQLAVTTDALVEGVHFRRDWATDRQIGFKALAVNLSDLASMAAQPIAFTLAIGLPREFEDAALKQIGAGLGELAGRFAVPLVGGNFSRARELSLTITAMGTVEKPLRRDAAQPGERVLLLGPLGEAAAELRLLGSGRSLPPGRSALHEPLPLLYEALAIAPSSRCAIDLSDGLVQDATHLAEASGVRIELEWACIPQSDRFRERTLSLDATERAELLLAGGEDYALLFTAAPALAEKLVKTLEAVDIGRVTEGAGVVVHDLPPDVRLKGWDHFQSSPA